MDKHPVVIVDLEYPSPGVCRRAVFVLDDMDYSQCSKQEVYNIAQDFACRPYPNCVVNECEILCDNIHSLAKWDGVMEKNPMIYRRNDDGELFTLNDDNVTYSLKWFKDRKSLARKYTAKELEYFCTPITE